MFEFVVMENEFDSDSLLQSFQARLLNLVKRKRSIVEKIQNEDDDVRLMLLMTSLHSLNNEAKMMFANEKEKIEREVGEQLDKIFARYFGKN